jgi:radical SAM protein (TIGR01212 family)
MTKDKPYNTLDQYYKTKYGKKVSKIALNAGFTCPNRDGKKGHGGCLYCSVAKSGDFAGNINMSITDQFKEIKKVMENKWQNILYMPYLQAGTNTYSDIDTLRKIYLEAISVYKDETVGISIATRCDCLSNEVIDLLAEINKIKPVQIELGLQTSNEKTREYLNIGYTNEEFITAVKSLRKHNIEVVAHIINGLPNENEEDMLNTIKFINSLDIQGIKLHCLLVLKNTKLYDEYLKNKFKLQSLEEYVDICVKQITHLKDNIIIHRLAADGVVDDLVEPQWSRKKLVIMNEIDKKLRKENKYQSLEYNNGSN